VKGKELPQNTVVTRRRTIAVFLLTVIMGYQLYRLTICSAQPIVELKRASVTPDFSR